MDKINETADPAKMLSTPPFGPGFSREQAVRASRMEAWGSGFSDPGGDWVEFRLFDRKGVPFATKRIPGY